MNWHLIEIQESIANLNSDGKSGLTKAEAVARLEQYGANELIERGGRKPLQILWEQLTATMVLILIAAAVVAGLLGDYKNTISILAIVALYALLGFSQEYRAEKAIAALKKMSVPNVRVLRDGNLQEVPAHDLVPGDIIQLETGNVLPADLRLLEAVNLRIQEAALTGESEPIEKHTAKLSSEDLPLGDRRNMGYMGTIVTQGRGLALVIATGMQTELGKIAELIQQVKQENTQTGKYSAATAARCAWQKSRADRRGHCRAHFCTRSHARRRTSSHAADSRQCCRGNRPRGAARRRHRHARARRTAHVAAQCPHPQTARRRNAWLGHGHLLR